MTGTFMMMPVTVMIVMVLVVIIFRMKCHYSHCS